MSGCNERLMINKVRYYSVHTVAVYCSLLVGSEIYAIYLNNFSI